MIKRLNFPEYTSAQLNAALLCDKVNEVIEYLNDKESPSLKVSLFCDHTNSYQMKPGLMRCKNCKIIYKV